MSTTPENGAAESNGGRRWNLAAVPLPPVPAAAQSSDAPPPNANATSPASAAAGGPFSNHTVERDVSGERAGQARRFMLGPSEMAADLARRTQGWPRRVGSRLFVPSGSNGIRWIDTPDSLLGWIQDQSARASWGTGDDDAGRTLVTLRGFFEHLQQHAPEYDAAELLPYWPAVPSIYSAWRHFPTASEIDRGVSAAESDDARRLLDEFLAFFNPASVADHALIFALFLTPFWGGPCGARPLFVITTSDDTAATHDQQSGKTTLAQKLAAVAGGLFRISDDDRRGGATAGDDLTKKLTSDAAARRRVVLIDNSVGVLADRTVAELVTAEELSGRPAFGRHTIRPNRLTWVVTTNTPEMDADLASRAVLIRINHPASADPGWEARIDAFIGEFRTELVNSAITILRAGSVISESDLAAIGAARTHTRFAGWDRDVLGTHPAAVETLRARRDSISVVNVESDDCALLSNGFRERFGEQFDVELNHLAVCDIWNQTFGTRTDFRVIMRRLKSLIRKGRLPTLILKWPKRNGSPIIYRYIAQASDSE